MFYKIFLLVMQITLIQCLCNPKYFSQKFAFEPPEKCNNFSTTTFNSTEAQLFVPKGFEVITVWRCYLQGVYWQQISSLSPHYESNVKIEEINSPVDAEICKEISATKIYNGKKMDNVKGPGGNMYYLDLYEMKDLRSLNFTTTIAMTEEVGYSDGNTIQIPKFPENIAFKEGSFIFDNSTAIWNTSETCPFQSIGFFQILYTSDYIIIPKTMMLLSRMNNLACYNTLETFRNGFGIGWDESKESQVVASSPILPSFRRKRSNTFITPAEFTSSMVKFFLSQNDSIRKKRSLKIDEKFYNASESSNLYDFNSLYQAICNYHNEKVEKFLALATTNISKAMQLYVDDVLIFENSTTTRNYTYNICYPKPELFLPQSPDLLKKFQDPVSQYIKKLDPVIKNLNSATGPNIFSLTSIRNADPVEKIEYVVNKTAETFKNIYDSKFIDMVSSLYGLFFEPKAFFYNLGNNIKYYVLKWINDLNWLIYFIGGLTAAGMIMLAFYFCYSSKNKSNKAEVFTIIQKNARIASKTQKKNKRHSTLSIPITDDVFGKIGYSH